MRDGFVVEHQYPLKTGTRILTELIVTGQRREDGVLGPGEESTNGTAIILDVEAAFGPFEAVLCVFECRRVDRYRAELKVAQHVETVDIAVFRPLRLQGLAHLAVKHELLDRQHLLRITLIDHLALARHRDTEVIGAL